MIITKIANKLFTGTLTLSHIAIIIILIQIHDIKYLKSFMIDSRINKNFLIF